MNVLGWRHAAFLWMVLLIIFFAPLRARQTQSETRRPVAIATRTPVPPRIDGKVDAVWLRAKKYDHFIQRYPDQGKPATEETYFLVMYDDENLYLLFIMRDADPQNIPARLVDRDYYFSPDDNINFYLDTFNDQQRAFYFSTNPLGVKRDGLISNNGNRLDLNWDCVFDVAARKNKYGWVAEFKIPLKSIRFSLQNSPQKWGFNIWRVRRKNREISYWSLVSQDYRIYRLDRGGVLVIPDNNIRPGEQIQVWPYLTARSQTEDGIITNKPNAGVDVQYAITPENILNFTLNPDFGQVEIDREQINLDKRFELFYPEKRPFFLENTSLFNQIIKTFYSRRIGANSDIKGGLKFTGRSGKNSYGALAVATGDWKNRGIGDPNSDPPEEWYSVLRYQRDILQASNVGIMAVDLERNMWGRDYQFSRNVSLDWNIFIGLQNAFRGQVVYAANGPAGKVGKAATASLVHYDQRFMVGLSWMHYDADFDVDMTGFFPKLPNKGKDYGGLLLEYHPVINKGFVRSWGIQTVISGWKETLEGSPSLGNQSTAWVEFMDQSRVSFITSFYRDVESDYRVSPLKDIVYTGQDYTLRVQTDISKPVYFTASASYATQYYFQTYSVGKTMGLTTSLTLKPISNAFFTFSYERRRFLDDSLKLMPRERIGQSDAQVWIAKGRYLFSRDVFSRVFLQFTNGAEQYRWVLVNGNYELRYDVFDRLSANILLGWRFRPLSTIYLVYTDEWDNYNLPRLTSRNRILFFKISYLFDF